MAAPMSAREKCLQDAPQLLVEYGTSLFAVLMQVFRCAVNASVRQKALSAITKVLHFSSPDDLTELLRDLPVSAFVAALINSPEPQAALSALPMAEVLLLKLHAFLLLPFQLLPLVWLRNTPEISSVVPFTRDVPWFHVHHELTMSRALQQRGGVQHS